ncbi:hypothetical protein RRG08_066089 [Elysia crispata]|uniref:Receptor ligand binding region domain-containing protein n=1 Tax=Elysia crispata TaxID=231223 RepID=A0AAE1DH67_9GAST|nr:hypothetical protein RRG08_066089 [Elysia crispata]
MARRLVFLFLWAVTSLGFAASATSSVVDKRSGAVDARLVQDALNTTLNYGRLSLVVRNTAETAAESSQNPSNLLSLPTQPRLGEGQAVGEKRNTAETASESSQNPSNLLSLPTQPRLEEGQTEGEKRNTAETAEESSQNPSNLLSLPTQPRLGESQTVGEKRNKQKPIGTSSDVTEHSRSAVKINATATISTTTMITTAITTSLDADPLLYISRRSADGATKHVEDVMKSNISLILSPSSSSTSSPPSSPVSSTSVPSVRLVLLLPKSNDFEFNINITSVAVEIALEHLNTSGRTSGFRFVLGYGDSQCSEILGPIRAFEFFWQGLVDTFLGPFCDYSAAPVARYSAYWRVPVITAGALSHDFEKFKLTEYRTLTRVGASTVGVAALLTTAIKRHGWTRLVNIYDAQAVINTIPKLCYLTSSAVVAAAKDTRLEPTPVFLAEPEKMLRQEVGTDTAGKFLPCMMPK